MDTKTISVLKFCMDNFVLNKTAYYVLNEIIYYLTIKSYPHFILSIKFAFVSISFNMMTIITLCNSTEPVLVYSRCPIKFHLDL